MNNSYAKVVVDGSPISKSNFKLFNMNGRAILPFNSGKYHDRYAVYEQTIAYEAKVQNPSITFTESLIAVLKVYYKSEKRHPDTNNITKSIFDGIEKSGLIINDAQIRRLIIEEYYDKVNPRFELELYAESCYNMCYTIEKKERHDTPIEYSYPPNSPQRAGGIRKINNSAASNPNISGTKLCCNICGKAIEKDSSVSADHGKTIICRDCLKKLF